MVSFEKRTKKIVQVTGKSMNIMGAVSASDAATQLLKLKAKQRLALRQRMGLLKHKQIDEPLSEIEQKMLDHELAIAEELQANLLPRRIPQIDGYEFGAYYKPSKEIGGDYYDFIEIDESHLGMLVADVSGKGIPGSMVMTETRVLIRNEARHTLSPSEVLKRVNSFLNQDIKRGMFVTAFYAVLDIPSGTLTVSSAGHNPLILYRNATKSLHALNTGGLALGIDKGPLFERTIREQKLHLYKGDRFVLYTDGVIEAMNQQKQALGSQRFYLRIKQFAEKGSNEFISLIIKDVETHQGDAPQHDDITLVTGRYQPDQL
jgi:sigma-B regulation protein RsbU (phosphoserine phosphatase)